MMDQLAIDFAADTERDIARLVPLAKELAIKAHIGGITVANLRLAAVHQGILTGEEKGKRLSYLGTVMERAGLHATTEFRRSHIPKSHGNLHRVYVSPEFIEQRRAS